MKGTRLTVKERRFVDAYLGSCKGNGTQAYLTAGFTKSRNARSASVGATHLLAKPSIRAAVDARLAKETATSIATAEERDRILSEIMRMPLAELSSRIKAINELNKCTGRHSVKHSLEASDDLLELLGGRALPK